MKGKVKFYNESKGFGFITAEDGKEYFVHTSGLADGVRIKDNDSVTFDVVEGERGPKAENVALDTAAEESSDESANAEEENTDNAE